MTELHLNPWLLTQLLSKLFIYAGTAAVVGGGFIYLLATLNRIRQQHLASYIGSGAVVGSIALLVNFLAQVGDFSASGFGGMFDRDMFDLLWNSPVGLATEVRLAGFAGTLFCLFILTCCRSHSLLVWCGLTPFYLVSLALLGYGYSSVGHISELGSIPRTLIALHILAACWWVGALLPLWRLTYLPDSTALQTIMHQFGQWASGIVALLALAGAYLLTQLLGSISAFVTTTYGLSFLVKLTAVSAMLLLAANHKLRLVPNLHDNSTRIQLRKSIVLETVIAVIVLLLSAVFTTVLGPES